MIIVPCIPNGDPELKHLAHNNRFCMEVSEHSLKPNQRYIVFKQGFYYAYRWVADDRCPRYIGKFKHSFDALFKINRQNMRM